MIDLAVSGKTASRRFAGLDGKIAKYVLSSFERIGPNRFFDKPAARCHGRIRGERAGVVLNGSGGAAP